jgi:quinol-cytochrome oxidoreductase complex cytochrome b subunit
MTWLLIFIIAVILLGVWGAIKLTLWVLLIALVVAAVVGFAGRGMWARR